MSDLRTAYVRNGYMVVIPKRRLVIGNANTELVTYVVGLLPLLRMDDLKNSLVEPKH